MIAGVQDETVRRLSRLIQIDTFWKQLKNVRSKIKIFKYAQFMVTTCFFGFVFLAMPVADLSAGLIFIGLLAIVQAVEHAVYHYILHSSETISKWFELHLKRIEELSGIQRGNLARYAYYLAMGESSQWYVMTISLNLLGAGLVISLMNPLLLVPYSITIAVSFYIIIKNINGNDSFSSLQSSYLEGVQQIDQELGVAGFMGRTTQIDQQWESRLSKGLSRFIGKAKWFNGALMFATKVMLPAIGLISGHILEFYIISGYLAVILGAGDFIKALGESSLYSSRINVLLEKIIKNNQVISEQTWQSDQTIDLYGSEINPLLIKSYQFDSITSSIKNRAGKPVVRSVSLTVDQGEMLFIGAPSGSGKSMLAKLFTHNMNPAAGSSAINLLDGTTIQISSENVSFEHLKKVFHYIDYSKIVTSITPRQILDQFDKDSKAFISFISGIFPEFTELSLEKTFSEFSHGEQKRIASALYLYINEPPFIIFDEPLSGLDADSAKCVMEFFIEYKKHHNTTIIVIDHHVSENMLTSFDRKMTLSAGNLVPYSKREELQKWLDTSIDIKDISEPAEQENIGEPFISDLEENINCPEWLSHILHTLHTPDLIGAVSSNSENESIDLSIMRVLLILEMFGREDIYGKTAIWDFLQQRNEPEYQLALQVIQKLCSQTNDYIDSETQDTSLESISCNNTKNVLRTLYQVIQDNRDQYSSYGTYTDNISFTGLLQKMYSKKSKTRDRYIKEMLESTADKKVALSFSNTRKSIYDIMAVDYLFQQHNIDRKYFPFVLKNFSLTTFRARLSTLMSYNLPVNTSTLRLSTDQKVSDYAERYRLRQTVQQVNQTDIEGSQNPQPIKPIDPAYYRLLDSAA